MRQLEDLIAHPDSPFLRVVGLLYVRYVIDPKVTMLHPRMAR